ncbi:hypothetical protein [Empedobacter sp.]|uniref:hypothetical protein n=1 Tax=Empedobacter sp. TaxID=1927715 RepID=UPI00289E6737|nr:hypothetical protein [Empedobacter sp.]
MNSCLSNIVSVSNPCSEIKELSTSGYDILDAPELNKSNISQIAGSDNPNGYEFLKEQLKFATRDVTNDFIALLNTNNLITKIYNNSISTGEFNNGYTNTANNDQGITIHRNLKNIRPDSIKKLIIQSVLIYPMDDHDSTILFIEDGQETKEIPIQLIGGKINKFSINHRIENSSVNIYLKNISTYASNLTCLVGCNGTIPNECGFVKGYNNGNEVQREGFGINAVFTCECDYESLLCRYSKSYVGKIIFLKTRANILKERIHNDRINSFIIYGRDEAEKLSIELENEYRETWNAFVESVPNLLINDTDCIDCQKVKIVVNV